MQKRIKIEFYCLLCGYGNNYITCVRDDKRDLYICKSCGAKHRAKLEKKEVIVEALLTVKHCPYCGSGPLKRFEKDCFSCPSCNQEFRWDEKPIRNDDTETLRIQGVRE